MLAVERETVAVRLHGPLAERFGAEHHFRIGSPREAVAALDANYPGFKRAFLEGERYALLIDGDWFVDDSQFKDPAGLPVSRSVDICPVVEGRIVGVIAPLLVSAFGIGLTAATIISGVLVAGLLVGVSLLLSPKAKKKTSEDSKKDESYMFSGPENVIEQGVPVPVVYGQTFVGSVVISAGLEVNEIPVAPPPSLPWPWTGWPFPVGRMATETAFMDQPRQLIEINPRTPEGSRWSALRTRIQWPPNA